ncbi:MAG: hypothetical protein IPF83_00735 [Rhodanobacteraceae bacterium]|nr:hypothetical protein [Rhodanobacteraceae bacterium]
MSGLVTLARMACSFVTESTVMKNFLGFLLVGATTGASALDFSITNTANSGAGTLRQAMLAANANPGATHTLTFDSSYPLDGQVTLLSALPVVQTSTNLRGGNRRPVINGNHGFPILVIAADVTVDIDSVHFRNGMRSVGGCIALQAATTTGSLFIDRSNFDDCQARDPSTPGGGAIGWRTNDGQLGVSRSIFTNNSAVSSNASNEQPRGGAIESYSVTTLSNNTFESNGVASAGSSGGFGGAVYLSVPGGIFESEVSGNRFRFNSVTPTADTYGRGGAVYANLKNDSLLSVQRNWFRGNSARRGGALAGEANNGTVNQLTLRNNTFYNHSVTEAGGALSLKNLRLIAEHNSFFNNDAPLASHLQMIDGAALRFVNNVMAATYVGNACAQTGVDFSALYRAGNHFKTACTDWSDAGAVINPLMNSPVIDEGQRVGVLQVRRRRRRHRRCQSGAGRLLVGRCPRHYSSAGWRRQRHTGL